MGEKYDPFHVPQQNRRNKLRVNTNQQYVSDPVSLSLSFQLVEKGSGPLGPFTGYASVLRNSKFLKPAQQLFHDLFGPLNSDYLMPQPHPLMPDPLLQLQLHFNDANLVFLLHQVYKKYKVYCQQMQSVVASFETVAGLGNAAPYIYYAIKSVSKHFCHLKNALVNQIQFTNCNSNDKCHLQNPAVGLSFLQHPVWRSQRGLPDHAVALLKTWLFEVSNWFINARVRLWKPMVEEVYKLSSQQPQSAPLETMTQNTNNIIQRGGFYQHKPNNINNKRTRIELTNAHDHIMCGQHRQEEEQDKNLVCLENYQSNGNNVCLALGLHQNNNYVTPTSLPINISQRVSTLQMLGLMDSASAATFHSQSLNFGKE